MYYVKGESVGKAWIHYLENVLENGRNYFDEADEIVELDNIVIEIEKDEVNDPILKKYSDPKLKELYLKKMKTMEIVPELNASYGQRIYNQLGVNQYQWCLDRLKRKPETKAATMSLLLPDDPGPRIPCLDVIDFKLRNDTLYTKTFFRSQNAMNAYGNLCALFWLSGQLSNDLGITLGSIVCFISNGHIYKEKVEIAQSIVNDFHKCNGGI